MSLTAAKITHIKNKIASLQAGRSQQVILTMRTAAGGTTTLTVTAVWRVMGDFDPTYEGATNVRTHLGAEPDVNAIFDQAQVTLAQMKSVIWAVLGSGATGAQPATKYTLLDVEPIGMPPGGDRLYTKWTSQH